MPLRHGDNGHRQGNCETSTRRIPRSACGGAQQREAPVKVLHESLVFSEEDSPIANFR